MVINMSKAIVPLIVLNALPVLLSVIILQADINECSYTPLRLKGVPANESTLVADNSDVCRLVGAEIPPTA